MLSEWRGITCQHRSDDFPLIIDVIERHRPVIVVELGTDNGGFAALLADVIKPWGGHCYSYDVETRADVRLIEGRDNLTLAHADVLTMRDASLARLLAQPSVLLYCDDGNKEREISLYAPLLAPGSMLGTHDYVDEVDPQWVEPFLADLGFTPYRHDEFAALANEWYPHSLTRFWKRSSR